MGTGSKVYLYNGKELNTDFGLDMLDYGFRWYDPSIGRWHSVDPLAEMRMSSNPYNFVQNNPINRFDPDGLTDYAFNHRTGDVTEIEDTATEEGPDRLIKTNRKGKPKYRKKTGEAKVAVGGVAKGILKDGMNLKENSNRVEVGGDGQPSVADVEDFSLNLSEFLSKEISGTHYSKDGASGITDVVIGRYKDNKLTHTADFGADIGNTLEVNSDKSRYRRVSQYHTHPQGYSDSDRLRPSESDIRQRDRLLAKQPWLRFYIISRPKNYGGNPRIDYTNKFRERLQ